MTVETGWLLIVFVELNEENAWYVLDAAKTFHVTPDDVKARDNVVRVNALKLTEAEFIDQFEKVYKPVVIKNAQLEWAAKEKWTLEVFVCTCLFHLYRAMLCIRGTSHGPVSVSVTSRSSTKMAKHRITQTTPHDSTGTLVFWCQRCPRNSTGVTPYGGTKCRWGG